MAVDTGTWRQQRKAIQTPPPLSPRLFGLLTTYSDVHAHACTYILVKYETPCLFFRVLVVLLTDVEHSTQARRLEVLGRRARRCLNIYTFVEAWVQHTDV